MTVIGVGPRAGYRVGNLVFSFARWKAGKKLNGSTINIALVFLGSTIIICLTGSFYLVANHIEIPSIVQVTTGAAIGAIGSVITHKESDNGNGNGK